MSRPSTMTWPEVGLSSPPNSCSSVVLPEPDAPTIAMRSPDRTARLMPRRTSRVTGPWRKLLWTSRASRTTSFIEGSLVTQSVCGRGARGAPGGVDRGQHAQQKCHRADPQDIAPLDVRRQLTHEVHAGIHELHAKQPLEPIQQRLQVVGQHGAES